MDELDLIRALGAAPGHAPDLLRSMGDDCAVIAAGEDRVLLLSMDCLVQDVHFGPWHPPELLGRKAVSVNVSDIAAMGGEPRFLLLGLCLPPGLPEDWFPAFHQGLRQACAGYGCLLIGGDTVRGREISLSLTAVGQARPGDVVLRSGARAGDQVWATGPLGEAAAGLELCRRGLDTAGDPLLERCVQAHLDPHAQVACGRSLAASGLARAMMDMSDGLATDLAHVCAASGLGARIGPPPLSPALRRAAEVLEDWDPRQAALAGGEDYQLLFTAAPGQEEALRRLCPEALLLGTMVPGEGVVLEEGGRTRDIGFQGWRHRLD